MKYLLIFESFKEVEKLDLASQIFIHWKIKNYIVKGDNFDVIKQAIKSAGNI